MAGTITSNANTIGRELVTNHRNAIELLVSWVGDASDGTVPSLAVTGYQGWWITKVVTVPGSVAPTTLYDITFLDSDGIDLMSGDLLNRSATLPEEADTASQVPYGGFTIAISNQSVVSATGTIRVFLNR